MDFTQRLSAELQGVSLGTAVLRPKGELDYQVYSLSGILYGLNDRKKRELRKDWSVFLRLGAGKMNNSATIPFERKNDYHFLLGLGAEYGFDSGAAARAEYIHYDADAQYVGFSLLYRFTNRDEQKSVQKPIQTAIIEPAPVQEPEPQLIVEKLSPDSDGLDGI